MISGFDLFTTKNFYEEINISDIEKKYGYDIPPLLRLFSSIYNWKTLDYSNLNFYFYPNLTYGDIQFLAHDLEAMIQLSINTNDDDVIENKLIGLATGYKGIYIGTLGDQADKIILDDSGDFEVIAENIFMFFRGVTDNLIKTARSEKEYMQFMKQLGYEGEELVQEGKDWIKFNSTED